MESSLDLRGIQEYSGLKAELLEVKEMVTNVSSQATPVVTVGFHRCRFGNWSPFAARVDGPQTACYLYIPM